MADGTKRAVRAEMDRYRLPDIAGMNVVCSGCVALRNMFSLFFVM